MNEFTLTELKILLEWYFIACGFFAEHGFEIDDDVANLYSKLLNMKKEKEALE